MTRAGPAGMPASMMPVLGSAMARTAGAKSAAWATRRTSSIRAPAASACWLMPSRLMVMWLGPVLSMQATSPTLRAARRWREGRPKALTVSLLDLNVDADARDILGWVELQRRRRRRAVVTGRLGDARALRGRGAGGGRASRWTAGRRRDQGGGRLQALRRVPLAAAEPGAQVEL